MSLPFSLHKHVATNSFLNFNVYITTDCTSLATNKLNSGKPQLCLNREEGHAEVGKIIRFHVVKQ